MAPNCLVSDREIAFLIDDFLDVDHLLSLPQFKDHSRETFDLYVKGTRRLAREVMFPAYKPMDEEPAKLVDGRIVTHDKMKEIFGHLVELGVISATRPAHVGGGELPGTIATVASFYLMAANIAASCYAGLTTGAARLIESFGSDALKERFMRPMYEGLVTGTMALTEPQAGSSLNDVLSTATDTGQGHYLVRGNKIFISGGDHDLTDNIVHLTLARIEGAPAGLKGVSLFAIPRLREDGDRLVPNDCSTAGSFRKIGWKGLASIALSFGENDDCHGWLVGEPHCGIKYMFQMMNEARLMVGASAVGTASVAYQASLQYAMERPQGRRLGVKDPTSPQIPIIEHAEVRRMLLRQKAIVEGGMALVAKTAQYADLANAETSQEARDRAHLLVDLLTPIAKSFPSEWGNESNTLAIQVHGGYGYTSEYLPEAWWRDQRLNTLHEGTTQIQGLDLLGRKVVQARGQALMLIAAEVECTIEKAQACGLNAQWISDVREAKDAMVALTVALSSRGLAGDIAGMLGHSGDYLTLASIVTVAWLWLEQAAIAQTKLTAATVASEDDQDFLRGKLQTAKYWIATELPLTKHLVALCQNAESSYDEMKAEWF